MPSDDDFSPHVWVEISEDDYKREKGVCACILYRRIGRNQLECMMANLSHDIDGWGKAHFTSIQIISVLFNSF